jgi:hypothetical protein
LKVLRAPQQALSIDTPQLQAIALSRLEALATEEMLDGDTPSMVIVMEAGDLLPSLNRELGFDVLKARYSACRFDEDGYAPTFEVMEEHLSVFELVFVFSDYGDGAIVLVPKQEGVNPDLLAMCRMHAVPAKEPHP